MAVVAQQRDLAAELAWMVMGAVKLMVVDPDQVSVTGAWANGSVVVTVTVSARDMGRVIGKEGRTARSLRTVLDAAGLKHGVHCQLNIQELQPVRERRAR
jgi:hypothetical protein